MFSEAIFIAIKFFTKSRYDRITYIRSFKKGKCLLIYPIAFALYLTGKLYAGMSVAEAIFTSVNNVVVLVVLRYNPSDLNVLIQDNKLFEVTLYLCYVFVTINAILFVLSVGNQQILNALSNATFKLSKQKKYIIIGNNSDNYKIYDSIKSKSKILVDSADKDVKASCAELYRRRINYNLMGKSAWRGIAEFCIKNSSHQNCTVIINTQNDETNLKICAQFSQVFSELASTENNTEKHVPLFEKINVFVYGNEELESLYLDIADNSYGCIHYITRHRMIAFDFEDNYPFAKFMNEQSIDYSTALLKDEAEINVAMLGFGKVNRELFKMSAVNNQFLGGTQENPIQRPVNYHIFEKGRSDSKNLNHNFFRYNLEFSDLSEAQKKNYLPLPMPPANVTFEDDFDICQRDFYKHLFNLFKPEKTKRKTNFIIIALGSDSENIDFAQKMIEKKNEWQLDNLTVFVRLRSDSLAKAFENTFKKQNCFIFGEDTRTVYNITKIEKEKFYNMAMQRHISYAVENELKTNPNADLEQIKAHAIYEWNVNLSYSQRLSNLYCCLSMRSKLLLIGLDICTSNDKNNLSKQIFFDKYFAGDRPQNIELESDKPIIKYTLDFPVSLRRTLAILEHYRWNAFMIMQGFVPSTIEQIKNEKYHGKNYSQRRHGNLTTFEGLIEFRKLVAQKTGAAQEACDVFKYDYQIMDDAWWFLKKCDCGIKVKSYEEN